MDKLFLGLFLLSLLADGVITLRRVHRFGKAAELNPLLRALIAKLGPVLGIAAGLGIYALVGGGLFAFKLSSLLAFYCGIEFRNVLGAIWGNALERDMAKVGLQLGNPVSATILPSAPGPKS